MASNFVEMRHALAAMKRENARLQATVKKLELTLEEREEELRKVRSDAKFQAMVAR